MIKIAAVSYIERTDGRILCVWNKRYGGWSMPGGLVEHNETVEQAQVRELREETGLATAEAFPIFVRSIAGKYHACPVDTQGCPWTTGGDENGVGAVRCGRPITHRCTNAPDTCERHKSSCCVPNDGRQPDNQGKYPERASIVHVFRVVPCGEPKEAEQGCPVTWLTRDEFLQWSPFKEIYKEMFEAHPRNYPYTEAKDLPKTVKARRDFVTNCLIRWRVAKSSVDFIRVTGLKIGPSVAQGAQANLAVAECAADTPILARMLSEVLDEQALLHYHIEQAALKNDKD